MLNSQSPYLVPAPGVKKKDKHALKEQKIRMSNHAFLSPPPSPTCTTNTSKILKGRVTPLFLFTSGDAIN